MHGFSDIFMQLILIFGQSKIAPKVKSDLDRRVQMIKNVLNFIKKTAQDSEEEEKALAKAVLLDASKIHVDDRI